MSDFEKSLEGLNVRNRGTFIRGLLLFLGVDIGRFGLR